MAGICDVCKALGFFQESAAGNACLRSGLKLLGRKTKKWHVTMKDLCLSAEAGCRCCTLVCEGFKEGTRKDFDIEAEGDALAKVDISFEARYYYDTYKVESFDLIFEATDQSPDDEGSCFGSSFPVSLCFVPAMMSPEVTTHYLVPPIEKSAKALERALPYQNGGIWPGDSTRSGASWELARSWLTKCLSEHSECPGDPALQTWRPARLLHIRNNNPLSVRLVTEDESSESTTYFSLSHCWGKSQVLRLLQGNMEQFKQAIPVDQLSKTYRECMEFVGSTEVPYIWIDSLCIIQDSKKDTFEQFPLMSKIYGCAICNITANNSVDDSGGLFRGRDAHSIMPLYLAISLLEPFVNRPKDSNYIDMAKNLFKKGMKSVLPTIGVWVLLDDDLWRKEIINAPLSERAWVFQEYLLAKRTIHFGADQLFFECGRDKYCESYPNGLPPRLKYHADFFTHSRRMKQPLVIYEWEGKPETPLGAFWNWGQMILTYTSLKLTDPWDKLWAICGVAQEYQKITKSRYVAGMWEDTLLSQLLWRADYFVKRPRKYRAPTWSWASVDGAIQPSSSEELMVATWSGWEKIKDDEETLSTTTVLANIVKVSISLEVDQIETGPVKGGFLRMRGRLVPVSLRHNCDDDHNPGVLELAMSGERWGILYIDIDPREDSLEGPFFCVPLSSEGSEKCSGLLLRATGGARGQFERFGILEGQEGGTQYFCDEQGRVESDSIGGEFYREKTCEGGFYKYEFDIV